MNLIFSKQIKILYELQSNLWKKNNELENIQNEKLKVILTHAYENVPYYHKLFDSVGLKPEDIIDYNEFSRIPITTKKELRNAKQEIIAKNVNLKKCNKHKTSGSTGIPLELLFTKEDGLYAGYSYERVRRENGYEPLNDSFLVVGMRGNIKSQSYYQKIKSIIGRHINGRRRIYNLSVFDPIETQIDQLKKIRPDVMWGYPSAINILAKAVEEKEINEISPRLVFTASEVLDKEKRDNICNIFGCDLFDVYGAWETGCIAWECKEHSGYHVNMDTIFLELLDDDGNNVREGEPGRVVVTNLHSFAMPIIRYEIGDFAVPIYEKCCCGRGGYLIKSIEGRYDDYITLPGQKVIAPSVIKGRIKESVSGISEFQIVQEAVDNIIIYIVKEQAINETKLNADINKVIHDLRDTLGSNVQIQSIIVDELKKQSSGKLRTVISKVQ